MMYLLIVSLNVPPVALIRQDFFRAINGHSPPKKCNHRCSLKNLGSIKPEKNPGQGTSNRKEQPRIHRERASLPVKNYGCRRHKEKQEQMLTIAPEWFCQGEIYLIIQFANKPYKDRIVHKNRSSELDIFSFISYVREGIGIRVQTLTTDPSI
jgi:hypothetical protein